MIEIPFWNDFYSTVRPENKNEIIEHCMNPSLELPKMEFEWGDACLSDKVSLKLTGFTELLQPYIIEVLSEVVSVNYRFTIDEVWKNTYHRYYHQEQHDHQGYELSFVIFINDFHQDDAHFYFVNERNRVTPPDWTDMCYGMPDDLIIEPKRGDILFFPSHMLHGVTPHKSDNPRITISGNISIHQVGEKNPTREVH